MWYGRHSYRPCLFLVEGALVLSNTTGFPDSTLNLSEDVAVVLMATLVMHYPDMLRFRDSSPYVTRMCEAMMERAVWGSELLAWAATIRRAFMPP